MPINIASFFQPRNATNPDPALRNTYYLLEDIYLKGGLQIRADHADRDSINVLNRKAGMVVRTVNDGKFWTLQPDLTTWAELTFGSTPTRKQKTFILHGSNWPSLDERLYPGRWVDWDVETGKSAILLELSVNDVCVVEIHGNPQREDNNPYKFLATKDHLADDGSTLMSDGSTFRGRRFSIISNLQTPVQKTTFFRLINQGSSPEIFVVNITYLTLE